MSPAYAVVRQFEDAVAKYAGSHFAVAVDSCTNALFLSCSYCLTIDKYCDLISVMIPSRTYISVPGAIIHAGLSIFFIDVNWRGYYPLHPLPIVDGAPRFKRGMYVPETFHCLSFHSKKHLPIGKGGMILTDSKEAADWFRVARYEGRHECELKDDTIEMIGWNMYMTPEQAARGLMLLQHMPDDNEDLPNDYPDLSKMKIFQGCT